MRLLAGDYPCEGWATGSKSALRCMTATSRGMPAMRFCWVAKSWAGPGIDRKAGSVLSSAASVPMEYRGRQKV